MLNRRNAVTGWLTLKVGKWFLRRKAKQVNLNPFARRAAGKDKRAKGPKGGKR
jgi:hypothetical protein